MTLAFNEAAIDNSKLDWANIDPASLPSALAKQYEAYRTAYAHAKAAREAFEQSFRAAVVAPAGKQAVLGYRFGKLSYAFAPLKAPASKANLVAFASLTRK